MPKLIVLTKNHFPSKDASAIRYENFFTLFKEFGYTDIVVFEYGYNEYKKTIDQGLYKSISLRKQPFKKIPLLSKIISRINYENRYLKSLRRAVNEHDLVLIGSNFSLSNIRKAHSIALNANAKLVMSLTEKYSANEFLFHGLFSSEYKKNEQIYKKYTEKDPPIICISSFMANCFSAKNIKTCVIPFVFDSKAFYKANPINHSKNNEKVSFLYCGKPLKKDLLAEMIRGFLLLDDLSLKQIKLDVIGENDNWKNKNFNDDEIKKIDTFAFFHGSRNRKEVASAYQKTNYSILLRPYEEDYAKAGFPTKISESLFFGVPPITNLTSDLHLYLKDGFNSFIVDGQTKKEFAVAIKKAIEIAKKHDAYSSMVNNALETAASYLDVLNFKHEIKKILN